jgi:hypothetical protein
MQEQKKGTKNLTRTCPTALALYFPFSFIFVLVRRARRVHLLQQISRLLRFSHSAQNALRSWRLLLQEQQQLKKKPSGDVRRKEGDQGRGNNVANASVGRKIGGRRVRV